LIHGKLDLDLFEEGSTISYLKITNENLWRVLKDSGGILKHEKN